MLGSFAEAQVIRSRSYRPAYTGRHHVYHGGHYRGYRGYIGVGRSGYGYGGGGHVSLRHPVYRYNPYYVARAPLVVGGTYIPQYYVREELTKTIVAEKVEVIKLKPGESIQNGDVVVANIDGKLVILQAVKDNGEQ